jgi:BirA family biotin operon repressor/biotin-[acetyl-CoA-carboxylase] ligase
VSGAASVARRRLHAFHRVDSTNDLAKALAAGGAACGSVVLAREQTGGRGRHGRVWASPRGNLYLSVILRPDCPAGRGAELSFLAAVAAAEALGRFLPAGREVSLKWPNDLLVDGAKIGGILLESQLVAGRLAWAVIGIGINIVTAPSETPYPATSLVACGGRPVGAPALTRILLTSLAAWYGRWQAEGFAPVREAWSRRGHRPGDKLTVHEGTRLLQGTFVGLGSDGSLNLASGHGSLHIVAGEVVRLHQREGN